MTIKSLKQSDISAIVEMALSDHVSFANIKVEYGLQEREVKVLMRTTLKRSSYRSWRRRIRVFGDRRETYK